MLSDAITRYYEAQRAWRAVAESDNAGECPEWDAYESAEDAVLNYPCKSLDDVREKASFVLSDESARDSLRSCYNPADGTPSLVPFLRSLLGEGVDNGGN